MNERIQELAEQAGYNIKELDAQEQMVAQKFAELIVQDHATRLVQAHMSNTEYAKAMDAYYEQKWAHRFD